MALGQGVFVDGVVGDFEHRRRHTLVRTEFVSERAKVLNAKLTESVRSISI